ncbi:piggyBac transposable element-derived protein 2-like [Ixodes scapularis]|uniref:piggyBac transposable element-derived protein 2-like n=1 Tax=Ixodes scapularis TaxID=6945 RepID=UPI001A9D7937|nr:piggyBac transposable element-derived protein 2-like [Ixodes scapularis]
MEARSFYGKKKIPCRTRLPPEDGSDDSWLSDTDNEDADYNPPQQFNAPPDHDTSEESEEEQESVPASSKGVNRPVHWSKTSSSLSNDVPQWKGAAHESEAVRSPIEYFQGFFDDNVFNLIVQQSNLYAVQQNPNKPLALSRVELEPFLGCTVYMSIFQLPRSRLYWSAECRLPVVADIMTRDRWEEIKSSLHFNDNLSMPPADSSPKDRLFKIRPLLEMLLPKFEEIPQEQCLCVDEQMVPFKGHSSIKQYLPKKPHKWGYKIFILCDSRGVVHSFDVYTGHIDQVPGFPDIGASGNIVIKLAQCVQPQLGHLLYFDNWFTSLKLLVTLAQRGIYALGTVRANRLQGCKMASDTELRKRGRGSAEEYEAVVDNQKVIVVKWYDNRSVTTASTFAGAQPVSTVMRWDRREKKSVQVECPSAVVTYNKYMGGVDLLDALIAYYRIQLRSKKFYLKLFFHFLDMVIVVSWLLYRRDCQSLGVPKNKQRDLLKFRLGIAEALCKQGKDLSSKKRGRPSGSLQAQLEMKKRRGPTSHIPNEDVRTDSTGHWPVVKDTRQRCKKPGCKGHTNVMCSKCNAHLCLNKNTNCFFDFHQP